MYREQGMNIFRDQEEERNVSVCYLFGLRKWDTTESEKKFIFVLSAGSCSFQFMLSMERLHIFKKHRLTFLLMVFEAINQKEFFDYYFLFMLVLLRRTSFLDTI